MLQANSGDEQVQVYYRATPETRAENLLTDPRLSEFLPFLGHKTTVEKPFPGLGLSYGETIGAIHSLWRAGYIKCDFKAEQDRILAAILRTQKEEEHAVRPEFDPEEPFDDGTAVTDGGMSDLGSVSPPPAVEVVPTTRDTVPR